MTERRALKSIVVVLLLAGCLVLLINGSSSGPCSASTQIARPLPRALAEERPSSAETVTFYAFGDWGRADARQRLVARIFSEDLELLSQEERNLEPFVLGLGDNVYVNGLKSGWKNLAVVQEQLRNTFGDVYSAARYRGQNITFHLTAGNHDHYGDVVHQETSAEAMFNGSQADTPIWKYYPMSAPGVDDTNNLAEYQGLRQRDIRQNTLPQLIDVDTKEIAIAAIDSQVMLWLYQEKNEELKKLHWNRLRELFEQRSQVKWRFIFAHHPIATHGSHRNQSKSLRERYWEWIKGTNKQHLSHPAYQEFAKDMRVFLSEQKIDFYLTGHDHNLQFIDLGQESYQVISGAAGNALGTHSCRDTLYANSNLGFVRFDVLGEKLWMEFIPIDESRQERLESSIFVLSK